MRHLKILSILLLTMTIALTASADKSAYEKQMDKAMMLLNSASTQDDYEIAANHFERIALNDKEHWQPIYYLAFIETMQTLQAKDKLDASAKLANRIPELSSKLELKEVQINNNAQSEIHALLGMMYTTRILIDKTTSDDLSPMAAEHLTQALALNPDNPRARLMDCLNLYYMPDADYNKVSTVAEQCVPYFVREAAQEPADYMPRWGRTQLDTLLDQIAKK